MFALALMLAFVLASAFTLAFAPALAARPFDSLRSLGTTGEKRRRRASYLPSRRALSLARASGLMRSATVFFRATFGASSRRASV